MSASASSSTQATRAAPYPSRSATVSALAVSSLALLAYEWNNGTSFGENDVEYGHRNVYFLDPSNPEGTYVTSSSGACSPGRGS